MTCFLDLHVHTDASDDGRSRNRPVICPLCVDTSQPGISSTPSSSAGTGVHRL